MSSAADPTVLQQRLMTVAERLDEYRWRYEQARDSRCVFTYAYVLLTTRIARELSTTGYVNPTWVVELAETFVGLYFAALDASAADEPVSPAWEATFEAMDHKRSSVLEDLVFGITVHIVHDLPHGLRAVGLEGANGSNAHDFHALNKVMAQEVDEIKSCITRRYAPYLAWLDRLGSRYEDILTTDGITTSRGIAWYDAVLLGDPPSEHETQEAIEHGPIAFMQTVLNPPIWSLRMFLRLCRFIVGLLRRWPTTNLPSPRLASTSTVAPSETPALTRKET